jgi:hypothetical protein
MKHSHKHNNYIHAKNRFRQRFGLNINKKVYQALCQKIRLGLSKPLGSWSETRSIHEIKLDNKIYKVVYSSNTHNIVTVLPENAVAHLKRGLALEDASATYKRVC